MKVISFEEKYRKAFINLNIAWIDGMFSLEEEDIKVLNSIDSEREKGAEIFFALEDDGSVISTCMIAPKENGEWEIEKLATDIAKRHNGGGSLVLQACIEYAKSKGAKKIIIVTNSKCESAVRLYRKHGFKEIPLDKKKFNFKRANLSFELPLTELKHC